LEFFIDIIFPTPL